MSDLESLGWRPHATKGGVLIRPMEGTESLVNFLDSIGSSTIISSAVSVSTSIHNLESVLKRAWVKLRNVNPSLAASTYRENGQGYLCYDANDTKEWLEETFIVHQHMTYEEMYCNTSPFKRTQLHWFQHDDHQEFYIRSIHEVIDGMGSIQLTNQLLEFIAASQTEQTAQNDVVLNLTPPLSIAACVGPEAYAEDGGKILQRFATGIEENAAALPAKPSPSSPSQPARLDKSFSSSVTSLILKACKENGITITHAYHAAFVISIMKLNPPQNSKGIHASPLSMNVRDKLQAPYRGSKRPVALYIATNFLFVPMPNHPENVTKNFLPLTRVFKDKYTEAREDPKLIDMQKAQMDMTVQFLTQMKSHDSTASNSPSVSSLGNLDHILKTRYDDNLVVQKYFYGVQMRGSCQAAIWTYQGKLNTSFFFDQGDFDTAFLKDLLVETTKTLLTGLGVRDDLQDKA